MKKYLSIKLLLVLLVSGVLAVYDAPKSVQDKIPFLPESFKEQVNLGLDLQGGAQLDYKIVLPEIGETEQDQLIEGVFAVIEKRVNSLGVAEPNIYRSDIGDEKHIVVELADNAVITPEDITLYLASTKTPAELTEDEKKTISLEKAKATVGKTIQLEFKEQKAEIDPTEKDKVKTQAEATLNRIKEGEDFAIVGQELVQSNPGKVNFTASPFTFESALPAQIKDIVAKLEPGKYHNNTIELSGNFAITAEGNAVEQGTYTLVRLLEKKEELKNEREVLASHILITWSGLDSTPVGVTRTEAEAKTRTEEVLKKLQDGGDFAALAKEYSEDASNKDTGGKLATPVSGDGSYVYDFETAALGLKKAGDLTKAVKTEFGYHIIKAEEIKTDVKETQYKYETIDFSTAPDPWQSTELNGKHFVRALVQTDQLLQPFVEIQFDQEGAAMFEALTAKNVGKPIAIFVGGQLISAPMVNEAIAGGTAIIQGNFTTEEATILARDLNTGAIPAPIILTGERTIGATVGQEALSDSLKAGAIGFAIVVLFMILYYRVPGLLAGIALAIYGIILVFLIKSELSTAIALLLTLGIFGTIVYRIYHNEDSGWDKFISFLLAGAGFFFFNNLLTTGVTLTLAGFAGVILSIGMAVDANILIFERIKDELKNGKTLDKAVDNGFKRAWSAIRDSNFSTLFTCIILFYFGSTTIQGFAFNLAAGVLVSMFTAIMITRSFVEWVIKKDFARKINLFGQKSREHRKINFIKNTRTYLSISGALVAFSLVFIVGFGLKLGLDFTGGSLMELQFKETTTKEQVQNALSESAATINDSLPPKAENTSGELTVSSNEPTTIDLTNATIVASGENGYLIKTKYLSSANHDKLLASLNEKLPEFTETNFTTIGPTIGASQLGKALWAVGIALIMIILYVSFAFRKVPKHVNPWRFGAVAIVALLHDVLITAGVFAVLGLALGVEIDALFITAILTVLGYSVNDTIVVLDRIRENLGSDKTADIAEVADRSLNETLARSINTSLSTLLTLIAILLFGSGSIFYFVLALTIGIGVGTYSSIFLASPLLVAWSKKR